MIDKLKSVIEVMQTAPICQNKSSIVAPPLSFKWDFRRKKFVLVDNRPLNDIRVY